MEFLILGSCVTRDIFDYVDKNEQVKDYYARESIISVMSNPLPISLEKINLSSNFQKRMVYYDCKKVFRKELYGGNKSFDYMIIDLIDERFTVIEIESTYITSSKELLESGICSDYKYYTLTFEEKNRIWKDSCRNFADFISPLVEKRKVILHEAYWTNTYSVDGKEEKFDVETSKRVHLNNLYLKQYYRFLKDYLGENLLVVSNNHPVADPKHKWGLNPVHYTGDYYQSIYDSIERLIVQK